MLPRPSRLLGKTLGRTLGFLGSLALKLGMARKALLVLAGVAALVVLGLLALALTLLGG